MDAAALLSAIVESSNDAIVGKGLDSVVLSWNEAAERIFGWTAQEMVGQSIRVLIPPDRQDEEDRILTSVGAGKRVPNFETVRLRKDGSEILVAVTVSPVRDESGAIVAASKIARDISEQVAIRNKLAESENRFRLLADNMAQLAWIADPQGRITWFNQRWFEYTGLDERIDQDARHALVHPDHAARVRRDFFAAIQGREEWEDTFPLRGANGEYRWFLSRAKPIHDAEGRISSWFGTNTDITAQREASRQIDMLLMEVNHRSKNMLAVIQSLARRTVAQGGEDFVDRFEARIAGLSANQDLLVRRSWSSVTVREMVEAQLEFVGRSVAQVEATGPDVSILPVAAEAIGMALHELATNALKYGALSVHDGHIALSWRIEATPGCAEGRPQFVFEWTEGRGPPVTEPTLTGFGTQIITEVAAGKLRGQAELSYPPEGLRWRVTCPAENALA